MKLILKLTQSWMKLILKLNSVLDETDFISNVASNPEFSFKISVIQD